MITPKEKYVFVHPKDADGNDILFRFMLSLSKKTADIQAPLSKALEDLPGLDGLALGVGQYTIEIIIARTFDPAEVIEELKRRLENDVLTDIIRPPVDLIVP